MNNHEPHHNHTHDNDRQQQLLALFASLNEITRRHVQELSTDVSSLDDTEQQALIEKINPHVNFEFQNHTPLHGLPLSATGDGMFFLSDFEGNILGVESITSSDIAIGQLSDICVLPTPTRECLAERNEQEIPLHEQVLSPIVILNNASFKTNRTAAGTYQTEHDLSNYQLCLPLAHYLQFTVA